MLQRLASCCVRSPASLGGRDKFIVDDIVKRLMRESERVPFSCALKIMRAYLEIRELDVRHCLGK